MNNLKKMTLIICLIIFNFQLYGQDTIKLNSLLKKADKIIEKINKKKSIKFGFSVGPRLAFSVGAADKFLAEASISPIDSTLQFELINRNTFLISALISVYPFENNTSIDSTRRKIWYKDFGFYVNINLAEIASDGNFENIFNQQIEGGLGVSYRFSESFAIGIGYEYIFHRRIRDYVFDFEGEQIMQNGKVITSLDANDNNLFRSDNVSALSIKFIFYL